MSKLTTIMFAAVMCISLTQPVIAGTYMTGMYSTPREILTTSGDPHAFSGDLTPYGSFASSQLSEADLASAFLLESVLSLSDLSAADLSGAVLDGADLYTTNMSNANLTNALMRDTQVAYSNLSGADLSSVLLDRADLYMSNLSNANFSNASLPDVMVQFADVSGAIFFGSDLRATPWLSLTNGSAYYDAGTLFGTTGDYAFDPTAAGWIYVPEPATLSLLALSGIAMLRRKRK
jgi:uncharacterized protein YjbI with pentapeptide repeats